MRKPTTSDSVVDSKAQVLENLVSKAQAYNLIEQHLDDLVHDATEHYSSVTGVSYNQASRTASDANNAGVAYQLGYLLDSGYSESDVTILLEDLHIRSIIAQRLAIVHGFTSALDLGEGLVCSSMSDWLVESTSGGPVVYSRKMATETLDGKAGDSLSIRISFNPGSAEPEPSALWLSSGESLCVWQGVSTSCDASDGQTI